MVGAHIIIVEVSNEMIPKILFQGSFDIVVIVDLDLWRGEHCKF